MGKAFEIAYMMIMTIVESLESEHDNVHNKPKFFTITPQPSVEDGKLRLVRNVVGKKVEGDSKGLMKFHSVDKLGISNMSQEDKDSKTKDLKTEVEELAEENKENKTSIDNLDTLIGNKRQEFNEKEANYLKRQDSNIKVAMDSDEGLINEWTRKKKDKQGVFDQVEREIKEKKDELQALNEKEGSSQSQVLKIK